MKYLVSGLMLIVVSSAFAATAPTDCLKVKNSLDRRYCLDKYLESVKETHANEKKSWGAALPQADKEVKTQTMEESIQAKKEYLALIQQEILLDEKQLDAVKAVPVATLAAPVVEAPKKKKKHGIRIKW